MSEEHPITQPPKPSPSLTPAPVPRPTRRSPVDEDIERQLEAALSGMDAKALYGEPERRSKRQEPQGDGRKKGKVVSIHGDDVFVDVGGRSQGVLPLSSFPEGTPAPGTEVEVHIEGYDSANGLLVLSRQGAAVHVDWSTVAEGMIVEGRVTGTNKGGLEVEVNGIRGFMPISQIELFRVEDLNQYLNQRLKCLVTDVSPAERNLVVSRRALLEKEREAAREKLWAELEEGQVRTGTVRQVKEFGAFVDLGGADGLVHVSEMAWSRIEDPTSVVQPGQQVQVIVLKIDREGRKLSLGLKQLTESPWTKLEESFPTGGLVAGKVTRLADFGAFVELAPGIEGLIHISELSPQRVNRVGQVVKVGQEVTVRVLQIDPAKKRISLSLKAAATPAEEALAEQPTEPEAPRKPLPSHRKPLKGGL